MATTADNLDIQEIGLRDVNYMPPLAQAIPLGLQHVLAMFISNVTVPLIIAGAVGLPTDQTVFLVQMAMFVAGIATLVQTLGIGPIGARLPIVMGTSFGFVPVMIPVGESLGLPAVLGAAILTIPNAVLGGALIIIFGMITSAGIKMLSHVPLNKRNVVIIGVSLAFAIGLPSQRGLYAAAPEELKVILESGLIPGAIMSILLNLILPHATADGV